MISLDRPTWSAMIDAWRARNDPAVVAGSTTWTGRELLARAAGAAAHLRSLTDRTGPVPALLTSTAASFAYVVGGASGERPLAPLGPRFTERELAPCVAALASDILLTEAEFEPLASALAARSGARVVVVDEPPPGDERALPLEPAPEATAFVLHTSGTTGTPK